MTTQTYTNLINEGIKGLPTDILAEIVDFIYFLRKRKLQPETFEQEMQCALINASLNQMRLAEDTHLEKEFENYDKLYPVQ